MLFKAAIIGTMKLLQRTVSDSCRIVLWVLALCSPTLSMAAQSHSALVAVASNFTTAARALSSAFEETSDHTVTLTFGSTGQLYAQILQGAPYDVFLAADQRRPLRLEESGRTVAGSRSTYAIGALVLAARSGTGEITNVAARLRAGDYFRLALANPALAPYGRAAREVLTSLEVPDPANDGKLVLGENVGQVFAMLATGNVEFAFIAHAQLHGVTDRFAQWPVPAALHKPIRQDLVQLNRAAENPAATAFLQFLNTRTAREIVISHGYRVALD